MRTQFTFQAAVILPSGCDAILGPANLDAQRRSPACAGARSREDQRCRDRGEAGADYGGAFADAATRSATVVRRRRRVRRGSPSPARRSSSAWRAQKAVGSQNSVAGVEQGTLRLVGSDYGAPPRRAPARSSLFPAVVVRLSRRPSGALARGTGPPVHAATTGDDHEHQPTRDPGWVDQRVPLRMICPLQRPGRVLGPFGHFGACAGALTDSEVHDKVRDQPDRDAQTSTNAPRSTSSTRNPALATATAKSS